MGWPEILSILERELDRFYLTVQSLKSLRYWKDFKVSIQGGRDKRNAVR